MSSSSTATVRVPARPIARPVARERLPQPRLRVVAPVRRRSAGGLALLSVGLLGLGLLVLLLLNISIGKGAYTLTALQTEQRRLAEQQQALAEQVEAVSAPHQLAERARRLGMVPAPNPAFVMLPDGTVKGRPEVATAPPKPAREPGAKPAAKRTAGQQGTAPRAKRTANPDARTPDAQP